MKPENDKHANLSELGEFGLIKMLTEKITLKNPGSLVGVGDDAAVLDYPDKQVVVTTDLLTEGIHFDLVYTPLKHLGYKAAVINFSDLFAMNALPRQMLISIALSAKFTTQMIAELYEGIYLACERYGVDLVGGDTSSSVTGLTISITAIGEAVKDEIVYRNGAKVNDLICVSGNLGSAYMGLQLLEREKKIFGSTGQQPEMDEYGYILERHLKPEPRGDIVQLLRELNIKPTSMIDISDGLSSELLHICTASKKGCLVYASKIPIDPETEKMGKEINIDGLVAALNGGEDYELLFTVPLSAFEIIGKRPEISIIGHIVDESEGKRLVTQTGSLVDLKAQGWKAF
ncbi:MAG: thiamine-phosphate kinase [Bacteroidales bacterium]|nr:thiamine-phosphate kinase [Bacteroidales bacterium]